MVMMAMKFLIILGKVSLHMLRKKGFPRAGSGLLPYYCHSFCFLHVLLRHFRIHGLIFIVTGDTVLLCFL